MQHLDDGTLQAWLDGPRSGLSQEDRGEIERHLSTCEACTRRLEALDELSRRVETLFSGPDVASEPVPAYEAVVARAERHRATHRPRSRWTAAAWAASVAAAVGVGWLANGLHRGRADLSRAAEKAGPTDSSATASVVVAAKPVTDTPVQAAPAAAAAVPSSSETRTVASAKPTPDSAAHVPAAAGAPAPTPAPAPAFAELAARAKTRPDTTAAVVRGRVMDESGRPLQAAQVVVAGTGVGAFTQRDGTFELSLDRMPRDSAGREVTLEAKSIGYRQATRSLAMRGGEVASADFRLAPQTVALQELTVTGAAAPAAPVDAARRGLVAPKSGSPGQSWRSVGRANAEAAAGFVLLTVPDLRVVRIEVGTAVGMPVVRVVQDLAGGGHLELIEARDAVHVEPSGGGAQVSVRRGDVAIVASAPLTTEALTALLDRLR